MYTISSDYFRQQLEKAATIPPARSSLPIIQNILLRSVGHCLVLMATDLENFIEIPLWANGEGEINIVFPASIVINTLKNIDNQQIQISQVAESLIIKSDVGEYKIQGFAGADFPILQQPAPDNEVSIDASLLYDLLDGNSFACSKDSMKPAMCGIFFKFDEIGIEVASTDAHILARRSIATGNFDAFEFVLSGEAVKSLQKSNPKKEDVKIQASNKSIWFEFGETKIGCRRVNERFPEYNNVIPPSSTSKAIIDKKDLQKALTRLLVYANKTTFMGKFKFDAGRLNLISENLDNSGVANEHLNITYHGEPLEIGFNMQLMKAVVDHIKGDEVEFALGHASRACVITSQQDPEATMLIMPVMLNSHY